MLSIRIFTVHSLSYNLEWPLAKGSFCRNWKCLAYKAGHLEVIWKVEGSTQLITANARIVIDANVHGISFDQDTSSDDHGVPADFNDRSFNRCEQAFRGMFRTAGDAFGTDNTAGFIVIRKSMALRRLPLALRSVPVHATCELRRYLSAIAEWCKSFVLVLQVIEVYHRCCSFLGREVQLCSFTQATRLLRQCLFLAAQVFLCVKYERDENEIYLGSIRPLIHSTLSIFLNSQFPLPFEKYLLNQRSSGLILLPQQLIRPKASEDPPARIETTHENPAVPSR